MSQRSPALKSKRSSSGPANSNRRRAIILAGMLAAWWPAAFACCQTAGEGTAHAVVLERGREAVLSFDGMRRVVVSDPQVADVVVLTANDLLVRSAVGPALEEQAHTSLYVYDRAGLHKFAVTVVGFRAAERIALELEEALGPTMAAQVVSDRMVVVEGEVESERARESLKRMLEAASTDEVTVIDLVTTAGADDRSPAEAATGALEQVLPESVRARAVAEDVIVIEGEAPDHTSAADARDAVAAIAGEMKVIDRITVRGVDAEDATPTHQIQRVLGDEFSVTHIRDGVVAVEGSVASEQEFERVSRVLESFDEETQVLNMIAVVPPLPDLNAARQALQGALGQDIQVTKVGDRALMVEGSVPSEERLQQTQQVLDLFDNVPVVRAISIVEPDRRRVLVAVKVLEVTRGNDSDLGIDWGQYQGDQYGGASFRPQPFLFGQVPGSDSWPQLYRFSSQVHALIAKRKARILAEPNLLVNEEEDAEILIGGEIPVPISQEGVGGFAAITVEWKPFGVNLKIRPTISPDAERVLLEVEPEVSSLDFANGINISGLTLPALRTRRTQTTVTVPDSGVLAIGGLINSDESRSVSKLPILGDLPIIGQFFRHDTTRVTHSELIILVLPQILGEDGEPLHPIPVPEGYEDTDVMQFGAQPEQELRLGK